MKTEKQKYTLLTWRKEMATGSSLLAGEPHGGGAWQARVHRVTES